MYGAHRAPPAQQNGRLAELLDSVRVEFQDQAARTTEYEQQRKFTLLFYSLLHARTGCKP
jgi:hypothetical protein